MSGRDALAGIVLEPAAKTFCTANTFLGTQNGLVLQLRSIETVGAGFFDFLPEQHGVTPKPFLPLYTNCLRKSTSFLLFAQKKNQRREQKAIHPGRGEDQEGGKQKAEPSLGEFSPDVGLYGKSGSHGCRLHGNAYPAKSQHTSAEQESHCRTGNISQGTAPVGKLQKAHHHGLDRRRKTPQHPPLQKGNDHPEENNPAADNADASQRGHENVGVCRVGHAAF